MPNHADTLAQQLPVSKLFSTVIDPETGRMSLELNKEYFPSDRIPTLASVISKCREFRRFSGRNAQANCLYDIYNHQHIFAQLLQRNDCMAMFHEPGSGKTITSLYAALKMVNSSYYDRLMIVNTSNVQSNVAIRNAKDMTEYSKYKKIKIDSLTYRKLDQFLTIDPDNEKHISQFENTIWLFDEGHNLICDQSSDKAEKYKILNALIEVLRRVNNKKIIVITATPIINSTRGFVDIMSLLFLNNMRSDRMSDDSIQDFIRDKMDGMISYIDSSYDDIHIKQPKYKLKNKPDRPFWNSFEHERMSITFDQVNKFGENETFKCLFIKIPMMGAQLADLYMVARRSGGVDKSFMVSTKKYGFSSDRALLEPGACQCGGDCKICRNGGFASTGRGKLEYYSNKLAAAVALENESLGAAAMYLEFVDAGAKLIAQYLIRLGWCEYKPGMPHDHNMKRFMLYTVDKEKLRTESFEKFRSPGNWDGGFIKMIIGSSAMRDGVDILNARRIHIMIPEWHIPGLRQAWYRIIRSGSQEFIIRQMATIRSHEEGITYNEAYSAIKTIGVDICIYNYCSIFNDDEYFINSALPFLPEDMREDVDDLRDQVESFFDEQKIFHHIHDKYIPVGETMEILKITSVDSKINGVKSVNWAKDYGPEYERIHDTCYISESVEICKKIMVDELSHNRYLDIPEFISTHIEFNKRTIQYTIYDLVTVQKSHYFPLYFRICYFKTFGNFLFIAETPDTMLMTQRLDINRVSFVTLPQIQQFPTEEFIGIESPFRNEFIMNSLLELRNNPRCKNSKVLMKYLQYYDEYWAIRIKDKDNPIPAFIVFNIAPGARIISYRKPSNSWELSPGTDQWIKHAISNKQYKHYIRRVTRDLMYTSSAYIHNGDLYSTSGFGIVLFKCSKEEFHTSELTKASVKEFIIHRMGVRTSPRPGKTVDIQVALSYLNSHNNHPYMKSYLYGNIDTVFKTPQAYKIWIYERYIERYPQIPQFIADIYEGDKRKINNFMKMTFGERNIEYQQFIK